LCYAFILSNAPCTRHFSTHTYETSIILFVHRWNHDPLSQCLQFFKQLLELIVYSFFHKFQIPLWLQEFVRDYDREVSCWDCTIAGSFSTGMSWISCFIAAKLLSLCKLSLSSLS
jgi:hypothetical protein